MMKLYMVDELPASKHPWVLATYGDIVIAANAEHDVRYYRNGIRTRKAALPSRAGSELAEEVRLRAR